MDETFKQLLNRPADSHKYDYGHVLVIGGSPGMVGAPFLAAMSALRAGAGLVTIASSPEVISKLEERVAELMTLSLPRSNPGPLLEDFIKDRKVSVVVIGPGMKPGFALEILKILVKLDVNLIADGGALAALASNRALFGDRTNKNLMLTPHQGEFIRFFNETPEKDQLQEIARKFASEHKLILVLKGHPTYVYGPNKESYRNKSGGPELATAGSGDVLAGMIGGIVAQKIEPLKAAQAAVYLHGIAGEIAAESDTVAGVIASTITGKIPAALKKLTAK
jgi:hydroxyethylthiazole kinase-like uncharacterized protein yjeF